MLLVLNFSYKKKIKKKNWTTFSFEYYSTTDLSASRNCTHNMRLCSTAAKTAIITSAITHSSIKYTTTLTHTCTNTDDINRIQSLFFFWYIERQRARCEGKCMHHPFAIASKLFCCSFLVCFVSLVLMLIFVPLSPMHETT